MWSWSCFSPLLLSTLQENCDVPDVTSGHCRVPSRTIPGVLWEKLWKWVQKVVVCEPASVATAKNKFTFVWKRSVSAAPTRIPWDVFWSHRTVPTHEVKIIEPLKAELFAKFCWNNENCYNNNCTIGDFSQKQNTNITAQSKPNVWSQFSLPGQTANPTVWISVKGQ